MPELPARTSLSHPLRIARMPLGGGAIGMTICPGKTGPSQSGAAWSRDLGSDLVMIRAAGYQTLLTLMEAPEMRSYMVHEMQAACAAAEIAWVHFPIVDGSIPAPDQRPLWSDVSVQLQSGLELGQGLLIHCLGGLGRTGTVAAMLAQDMGLEPEAAMRAIRAVRPGAIENALQEDFVLGYRTWGEA